MRSFVLASLLALAFAASPIQFSGVFEPKTEYHYRFDGLVLAGLPNANTEAAHTRIQARARLQVIDDRYIHFQLIKIRLAASHTEQQEQYPSLDSLESRELPSEQEELLQMPVRVQYRDGAFSEIQFTQEDAEWSKNVKRAVLNLLQLHPEQSKEDKYELQGIYELEDKESRTYTVTERTVEGECQVTYTLVQDGPKTLVTKSVNFDKCVHEPFAAYGIRYNAKCSDCEPESRQLVQQQTVYTYTIEKKQIQQVDARSVYTLNVNNQPVMKTETRARLVFEELHKINKQIKKAEGPKEELIYSTEWEKKVEEFFKKGDKAEVQPFESYKTEQKLEQVKTITEVIMEQEDNKPETAHQLARLVRVLRMCSFDELDQVHQTIYKKSDDKIKSILEHALAIAGTKNTVQHLVNHIEKKEISALKAAQLLKSVQETPYPSELIADLLIQLAESRVAENEELMRQSAWLAAASVVRGVVARTHEKPMIRLSHEQLREIKQKYVRIFEKLFNKADSTYEKVLALKTIGNAAIDMTVSQLEKIIYENEHELTVRIEAIDALRLLKEEMPRKIQKILLPIYKNRMYAPELRMAALHRLFYTQPEQSVLSQVVYQLDRESNQQVAAFTYQLLQGYARSTNPCHKTFSAQIKTMLSFVRYQPQQNTMSAFARLPFFYEQTLTGAQFDFAALFGKNSVLPKELSATLESVFGGNWNQYFLQFGFSQQNIDRIVLKALNKLQTMEKEQTVVRGRRVQTGISFLKQIAQKMNIRARQQTQRQQPYAVFYMRYKDMDYVVLPVDMQQLEQLVEKYVENGKIDIRHIERLFNQQPKFDIHHAAFFYEATRKMPTSLGLPLTISGKIPTVFSAEGELSLEILPLEARVNFQVTPSLATTHISQMRLWTPLFEQGTKVLRSVRAYTPIKIQAKLSLKKDQLEIETQFVVPQKKQSIIQLSSRPVAFLRFPGQEQVQYVEAEENTMVVPQWQQKTQEIDETNEFFGLQVSVRGNALRQWTWENAALCEQDIEYTVDSKKDAVFSARFNIEQIKPTKMSNVQFEDIFEKEFESENRNENRRREYFEKMIREIQGQSGYKHRMNIKFEAPQEKFFNAELNTVCDNKVRVCKLNVDARRSPMQDERQEWTLKSEILAALPEQPSTLRELKEQPHREIQMTIQTSWGSQKKSQLTVNMQVEQTEEQQQLVRKADRELTGLSEYEQLIRAARLNYLQAVAEYKLQPETQAQFERFFNMLKAYNFWSTQEQQEENQENRVVVQLSVEPMTRRFANLTVKTPETRVWMNNVQIPRVYLPSIAQRSVRYQIKQKTNAVCQVAQNKVNTFDDVIYRTPLTTCFSVLAKDCSEEPKFAVFAKKMNKNSKTIMVKIVQGEESIEMEPRADKINIKVNGKQITKDQDYERYNIELLGEQLVVVQLEDGEVRFDGYNVKTDLTPTSQYQLCGLCGNNDDEKDNEFETADEEQTENIEKFYRSYLLQDEECNIEEERLSEKKNYRKMAQYEQDSQEYDEQYEQETEESTEGLYEKTRVVEFSHRVCFSIEPVNECRRGFQMEKTQMKKVRFTCLPRQQSEARRMLKQVREQRQPLRLTDYPVSYVEGIELPVACVAY